MRDVIYETSLVTLSPAGCPRPYRSGCNFLLQCSTGTCIIPPGCGYICNKGGRRTNYRDTAGTFIMLWWGKKEETRPQVPLSLTLFLHTLPPEDTLRLLAVVIIDFTSFNIHFLLILSCKAWHIQQAEQMFAHWNWGLLYEGIYVEETWTGKSRRAVKMPK